MAVNAGSSSLKLAAFDASGAPLAGHALAETDAGRLSEAAFAEAVAALGQGSAPSGIGHRVVHGLHLNAPALLTPETRAVIEQAAAFAPLHNPPALHVMDLCATLFDGVPQLACFDTAFHATNPDVATTFPLPEAFREAGIRRYGFHGLSYASLVRRFADATGTPLPRRVLMAHLGAGASLAAVCDGVGVATTMGFSPMDGLPMASRAGAMDPGVIFHLLREGRSAEEVEQLLNRESGLKGLAGTGAMKELLARDDAEARFAVEHYIHWIIRHAGAMCAAMGGIDAMVFTGGVGENAAPIRDGVVAGLDWAGLRPEPSFVIPADEEGEIAAALRTHLA
ncbi:acetate kinase [Rhodobacterales bacterium HKCCE4037]|nr:acetate kinase [Rhodobacterales bacterium HKCCE4037]